ncbi:hypothetical protein RJ639_022150 [Escallonia herrerae]|uniref:RNA polymerase Rpb1 domain-containing protein n=1 Tax=Escallonia herrerae TaxID=1293975 RepID=A0AA89AEL4_9ASTE|nr:hypothetical protein RJ639_022150 [Escallonia herrerae]
MPDEEINPERISPWLLRIELNLEMKLDKQLSMGGIAEKIKLVFNDDLKCIYSDDNAPNLILRIRIMNDEAPNRASKDESAEDDVFLKKIESSILTDLALQGIPGINKVFIKPLTSSKFDEDEGFRAEEEWMLDIEGVNLLAVMGHEHPTISFILTHISVIFTNISIVFTFKPDVQSQQIILRACGIVDGFHTSMSVTLFQLKMELIG